jgi:hypothetical protein
MLVAWKDVLRLGGTACLLFFLERVLHQLALCRCRCACASRALWVVCFSGGCSASLLTLLPSHNTPTSLWTVIHGQVYDLTPFVASHPGKVREPYACVVRSQAAHATACNSTLVDVPESGSIASISLISFKQRFYVLGPDTSRSPQAVSRAPSSVMALRAGDVQRVNACVTFGCLPCSVP